MTSPRRRAHVMLTPVEASRYLCRHAKYLRRLSADVKIKYSRFPGGHPRCDQEDLDGCVVEVSPW